MPGKDSTVLTLQDRKAIDLYLREGMKVGNIAKAIDRSHSCIKQEIRRLGGRQFYNWEKAQKLADASKAARIQKLFKQIPFDQAQEIKKMAQSGLSLNRISEATGLTGSTIKSFLKREKIQYKGKNYAGVEERFMNIEQQIEIILDMLKELTNGKYN